MEDRADVPLLHAMLCWNVWKFGGGAIVVPHPDWDNSAGRYSRAVGACFADPNENGGDRDWPRMTDAARMQHLLAFAWQAVMRDGVTIVDMHNALLVIPEFRALMTPDLLTGSDGDDD